MRAWQQAFRFPRFVVIVSIVGEHWPGCHAVVVDRLRKAALNVGRELIAPPTFLSAVRRS
jgi:hypothetical protein